MSAPITSPITSPVTSPVIFRIDQVIEPYYKDIYQLKDLVKAIFQYYSFRTVYDVTIDSVEEEKKKGKEERIWTFEITVYDKDAVLTLDSRIFRKILDNINFGQFIGYMLLSDTILTFMTSVKNVKCQYYNWGTVVKTTDITQDQINTIRSEVSGLKKQYTYLRESPMIIDLAHEHDIYHTTFEGFVILKLKYPMYDITRMISDKITKSSKYD